MVFIDKEGRFTEESFNQEDAAEVVILADTNIQSMDYQDIMKELIDNNQIIID